MNKYLMITAAALLAGGTGAHAGTHSFVFGTANGGSTCTSFTVTTGLDGGIDHNGAWAIVYHSCNGGSNFGQGLVEYGVKHLGDVADMSDTILGQAYGVYSQQLSVALPRKLKAGKPWSLWLGIDGISSFEMNSGVLLNDGAGRHGGRKSVLDAVRQLLPARRK